MTSKFDRNACESKSHRWSQYDAGVRHCKDCGQIDAYRVIARSAHADIEAGAPAGDAVAPFEWYVWLCGFADDTGGVPKDKFATIARGISDRLARPSPPIDGLVDRNPTEHEEWLTRRATLDRHRVLVLEKRLAASEAAVGVMTTALLRAREELEQWFDAAEVLKIVDAALSQAQPTAHPEGRGE